MNLLPCECLISSEKSWKCRLNSRLSLRLAASDLEESLTINAKGLLKRTISAFLPRHWLRLTHPRCDRCKSRKSKCVGLDSGRCQRCFRDGRICKLTKYKIEQDVLDFA
jgi:hypothetical protein